MTTKGKKSKNQISKHFADSEREGAADQSADQSNRAAQPSPGAVSDASMEVESDESQDANVVAADTQNEKEARDEEEERGTPAAAVKQDTGTSTGTGAREDDAAAEVR